MAVTTHSAKTSIEVTYTDNKKKKIIHNKKRNKPFCRRQGTKTLETIRVDRKLCNDEKFKYEFEKLLVIK